MDTNHILSLESRTGPKYRRLFDAIESAIRLGVLNEGAKLPPVRDLAYQLGITPGTVARAYQLATDEGLLDATVGRGTFVKGRDRRLPDIPANFVAQPAEDGHLNFRNGHTLDIGQSALVAEIITSILAEAPIEFAQYVRDSALRPCRDLAADWLRRHGVVTADADVVLTGGAHNSVVIALAAILQGREPVVATTHLTYPGFRQSAHISRARLVGVESDTDGIIPEALEDLCLRERPQALLMSSNVHNPTCVRTTPARREAIAALAQRFDFHIIEDDVYGVLITDRPDGFDHLCPERTWHATSLSKSFAAGLRVGFLACPPGMGGTGIRVMQGISLSISHLLTRTVERLFEGGHVDDYAHRIRAENTARTEIARGVLKDWDVQSQPGVNYVWVKKPEGWTSSTFARACEDRGILVAPGDHFALPGGRAPNAVRLTLSGAKDYQTIHEALRTIDDLLRHPPDRMLT